MQSDMPTSARAALHLHTLVIDACMFRLVQWDMRDPTGVVQEIAGPSVAHWKDGHMYNNKKTFSCIATSGQLLATRVGTVSPETEVLLLLCFVHYEACSGYWKTVAHHD